MKDKYFTVQDMAEMLLINKRTVLSLIKRKILKAVNVGTEKRANWRIYEGQYLSFLADSYEREKDED